jgi:hypothetical protein
MIGTDIAKASGRAGTGAVRTVCGQRYGAIIGLAVMLLAVPQRGDAACAAPSFYAPPPSQFAVGTQPWSVAVGDFNGDGKQDLATANPNSNNLSVLLGDGSGSFAAAVNFTVGSSPGWCSSMPRPRRRQARSAHYVGAVVLAASSPSWEGEPREDLITPSAL